MSILSGFCFLGLVFGCGFCALCLDLCFLDAEGRFDRLLVVVDGFGLLSSMLRIVGQCEWMNLLCYEEF